MNPVRRLIQRLDPVPPEYSHLAAGFTAEGEAFLRRWLVPGALLGGLMTLIYLPLPFIIYPQHQQITLLLYSAVFAIYLVVAAIFHFGREKTDTNLTILAGWTTVSLLSFTVMRLTNDFTSASGILVLTVVAYAGLIPWPARYMIYFFGLVGGLYLAMVLGFRADDNWVDYVIYGVLLLLVMFIFGAAYALIVRLRWQNFLNEQLIKAATARLQEDLAVAHGIQQNLLPPPRPNWPGFDVICHSAPAREVGGDLYSYHAFPPSADSRPRYALAVGDVSGKGLPAALLMAASVAHLDALLKQPLTPSQRLVALDQAMIPYTESTGQNCALCYVELHPAGEAAAPAQLIRVVNAGCIPPFVKRLDGSVEWLQTGGVPLGAGLGSQFGYPEVTASLYPGELLVLASDGLPEANNPADEILGFERVQAAIAAGPTGSAQAMLNHLLAETSAFIGQAEPHDDLTIVVLRSAPNPPPSHQI